MRKSHSITLDREMIQSFDKWCQQNRKWTKVDHAIAASFISVPTNKMLVNDRYRIHCQIKSGPYNSIWCSVDARIGENRSNESGTKQALYDLHLQQRWQMLARSVRRQVYWTASTLLYPLLPRHAKQLRNFKWLNHTSSRCTFSSSLECLPKCNQWGLATKIWRWSKICQK